MVYYNDMTKHNFTQKEVFKSSWAQVKENAWYLFTVFFFAMVLMNALSHTGIAQLLTGAVISISLITISLIIASGGRPSYEDLLKHFRNYKVPLTYALATLVYILNALVGFGATVALLGTLATAKVYGIQSGMNGIFLICALFILTSIYFAIRLQFYKFIVIEHENITALGALKKSLQITRGGFWKVTFFMITIILLNILGALFFGVGLILTVPVSLIAYAHVYKKISSQE